MFTLFLLLVSFFSLTVWRRYQSLHGIKAGEKKYSAMTSSSSSQLGEQPEQVTQEEVTIRSSLKFIVGNLKNIIPIPLSADNYHLWWSQITKLLWANKFEKIIDPSIPAPPCFLTQSNGSTTPNALYDQCLLTNQNLAAAICSTISSSILPYLVNLYSTSSIWTTLELRIQSFNR